MEEKDLPPVVIHDGATILLYSSVDTRHGYTGGTQHRVNGRLLGKASCLIIYYCGDGPDTSYYLLGHNPQWQGNSSTLTRHASLEEAQAQAEFEYTGVSRTWSLVT